jgi:hypothetical protein
MKLPHGRGYTGEVLDSNVSPFSNSPFPSRSKLKVLAGPHPMPTGRVARLYGL